MFGTKKSKQNEVDQHGELIEAHKRRDPDASEKTMRKHIYRSYCEFNELNRLPSVEEERLQGFDF